MPTYGYMCESCGYEFEQFQSITARPLRVCPECGKRGLRRLIGGGAGILFKGSGFYETDYRSESYKKAAEREKKAAEGGEKKQQKAASESKQRQASSQGRSEAKKKSA